MHTILHYFYPYFAPYHENFNFEVAVVYVEVEYYYSFIPLETNASELKSIIKSSDFKEYLNKKGSMLETITNN